MFYFQLTSKGTILSNFSLRCDELDLRKSLPWNQYFKVIADDRGSGAYKLLTVIKSSSSETQSPTFHCYMIDASEKRLHGNE
jgi:hypothetical protein